MTAAPIAAPATVRRQPLLRALLVVIMVIPLIAATVVASPIPFETRVEAGFLWLLCLLPSWIHLSTAPERQRPIPFIPMIGIIYGLYYALGVALGAANQHYKIFLNPERDYDDAIFVALYGWIAMGLAYLAAGLFVSPRRNTAPVEVPDVVRRRYGLLLMLGGLLLESFRLVSNIPVEVAGILKFLGTLGWFGSGLLVTMAVQRRLNVPYRIFTYSGVAAYLLMGVGSGSVANAAFFGAVIFVSAWIGLKRLRFSWIVGAVFGMLLIVSLRGVSEQYRKVVWIAGEGGGIVSRTGLFFRLLDARVQSDGVNGTVSKGFETSAGRSANLDLLANVIIRTPREIPYWGGETYLSLVGAFVPRVLWPDKPTKELGQAFGHRYGYIGQSDTNTALNLPILVEFYANFGIAGAIAGMFLVGLIYFVLDRTVNNPGQDTLHSLVGVVILIPLANIESDFSLGFGGLILNGVALWFVLRTIRRSGASKTPAEPPRAGGLQRFASQPRTT